MSTIRLRLDAADEGMHALGAEDNFNESMYFNFFDATHRLGGWMRLGNRANQGYAERTICLYLPDSTVAFDYARPTITSNDAFDAGGLRIELVEAFKELRATFAGDLLHLTDGMAMSDPKAAYAGNPKVPATIALTVEGVSPMLGGEPENLDGTPFEDPHGGDFARGHYEQHHVVTGTVTVGERSWTVTGPGLRDHSWGPRHWQSPWWYRWLTGNFGRDAGFVGSIVARQDGSRVFGGVVFRDGRYEPVTAARVHTDWEDGHNTQTGLSLTLTTAAGDYPIRGDVIGMVPLRNRRTTADGQALTTRIAEGLTVWTCPELSDSPGSGMSEYLDQVVDGWPVGRGEE